MVKTLQHSKHLFRDNNHQPIAAGSGMHVPVKPTVSLVYQMLTANYEYNLSHLFFLFLDFCKYF